MVWVGLATVAGVGLRFVQLPDFMLPVAVGVAVAAFVILVMRFMTPSSPAPAPAPPPPKPAPQSPSKRLPTLPRPGEAKKPLTARPEPKKDPTTHLAVLSRRPNSSPGQGARGGSGARPAGRPPTS
jgi:hypothetical protein